MHTFVRSPAAPALAVAAATCAAATLLMGGASANAAEADPPAGNACAVSVVHTERLTATLKLTCSSLEPGTRARAAATVNTPRNLDDYTISAWEGAWLESAPGSVDSVQQTRVGTIISDLHIQYAPLEG